MNVKSFCKALIIMLFVTVSDTIAGNVSVSMQGGEESLFSFMMSLIGVILLAPSCGGSAECVIFPR